MVHLRGNVLIDERLCFDEILSLQQITDTSKVSDAFLCFFFDFSLHLHCCIVVTETEKTDQNTRTSLRFARYLAFWDVYGA